MSQKTHCKAAETPGNAALRDTASRDDLVSCCAGAFEVPGSSSWVLAPHIPTSGPCGSASYALVTKLNFAGFGKLPMRATPRFTFSGFAKPAAPWDRNERGVRGSGDGIGGGDSGGNFGGKVTVGPWDTEWSPERHARWKLTPRHAVLTVLVAARRTTCPLSRLPLELLFEVFGWTVLQFRCATPIPVCDTTHIGGTGFGITLACTAECIFAANKRRDGVVVLTRAGELLRHIGAGQLKYCGAIVVVRENIIVSDSVALVIMVFRIADGARMWAFQCIAHYVAPAPNGLLVVSDRRTVQVIREEGTFVRLIDCGVDKFGPCGLAVDDGKVYVADCGNSRVACLRWSRESASTCSASQFSRTQWMYECSRG